MECSVQYNKWGRRGNPKSRYLFTIFTKDEFCKRGEYSEELDVYADGIGQAKKIAGVVLKELYEPNLRISRVDLVWKNY